MTYPVAPWPGPAAPAPLLPGQPVTFRLKTCLREFYLLDADWAAPAGELAEAEATREARLLAEGPGWLTVRSEGDGLDDVLEITLARHLLAPPPADSAAWPLRGEAALALPSGRLEVHSCPAHDVYFAVRLPPGTYRVRVSARPAATTSGAAPARSLLDLWPA